MKDDSIEVEVTEIPQGTLGTVDTPQGPVVVTEEDGFVEDDDAPRSFLVVTGEPHAVLAWIHAQYETRIGDVALDLQDAEERARELLDEALRALGI